MTEKDFKKLIEDAKNGKIMAVEELLEMYEPLINKYSYINGRLDDDLKQFLMLHILKRLPKFQI